MRFKGLGLTGRGIWVWGLGLDRLRHGGVKGLGVIG